MHEALVVHSGLPTGRHEDGGLERLYDSRPVEFEGGGKARAVVNGGLGRARTAEPHLPAALPRLGAGRRGGGADGERRDCTDGRDAQADQLHRLAEVVVAIGAPVAVMEGVGDVPQSGGVERT